MPDLTIAEMLKNMPDDELSALSKEWRTMVEDYYEAVCLKAMRALAQAFGRPPEPSRTQTYMMIRKDRYEAFLELLEDEPEDSTFPSIAGRNSLREDIRDVLGLKANGQLRNDVGERDAPAPSDGS